MNINFWDSFAKVSVAAVAFTLSSAAVNTAICAYLESQPVRVDVDFDADTNSVIAQETHWNISLSATARETNTRAYLLNEGLKCSFQDKAERQLHVIPHQSKQAICAPMESSDLEEARILLDQAKNNTPLPTLGMSVT